MLAEQLLADCPGTPLNDTLPARPVFDQLLLTATTASAVMCDRETIDADTVVEFCPWTATIVEERLGLGSPRRGLLDEPGGVVVFFSVLGHPATPSMTSTVRSTSIE